MYSSDVSSPEVHWVQFLTVMGEIRTPAIVEQKLNIPLNIFNKSIRGIIFLIFVIKSRIYILIAVLPFDETKSVAWAINPENWFTWVVLVSFWAYAAHSLVCQGTYPKAHSEHYWFDCFLQPYWSRMTR